jgi:ABC-2 type transport system ATP-binding protein
MIELKNIKKCYGKKTALAVDDLTIGVRECVGLVGNNGAGKTTMLSLILDLIQPTQGFITSKGEQVSGTDKWKSYTGSFLNDGFLIPFLTPLEYFEFIAGLHGMNSQDVKSFLAENEGFYNDDITSKKYIRELSAGNKNKVGILASILWKPEILILDEPFSNLDPSSQSWLKTKLKMLNREGVTMIISSHDLNHISEISSRVLLLEEGSFIKDIKSGTETLQELESYFSLC